VIDRTRRFDHSGTDTAVSIDELAVALHRDCGLQLDPTLGWHLWATDLCLQAEYRAGKPAARVIEIPLFHNSLSPHALPPAFQSSATALMQAHPGRSRIATLCGQIQRPPLVASTLEAPRLELTE
jgi:hypothetical protein